MSISSQESHLPIVIVGPGAMGCLFAGLLRESGVPVWILDKDPQRVDWIRRQGIRIEGIGGVRHVSIPITHQAETIGTAAAVLIWVKSYDTASAIQRALPLIGEATYVVSLQNGLGNLEVLANHVGAERVLGGTTAQGATLLGPGWVRHAGAGPTQIGWYPGQAPQTHRPPNATVRWLIETFRNAQIPTEWVEDVWGAMWRKLVVNAAINPLTALTRLKNGQLLDYPEMRRLIQAVVEEVRRVAQAEGVPLGADIGRHVEAVCRRTAANVSSMLQDIQRGKRTEIDAINGAVVTRAAKWELPVPVNQTLVDLIKVIERPTSGVKNNESSAQPG